LPKVISAQIGIMGSAESKQESKKDVSLSRSASLATGSNLYEAKETSNQFSGLSRISSMPKSIRRDGPSMNGLYQFSQLNPIPEEHAKEVFGLLDEDNRNAATTLVPAKCNSNVLLRHSVSFQLNRNSDSFQSIRETESDLRLSKRATVENTPNAFDMNCRFNSAPSTSTTKDLVSDKSLGLSSLLKPQLKPSKSFAAPKRNVNDSNSALFPNRSFGTRSYDGTDDDCFNDSSLGDHDGMRPEWINSPDILEGMQLFDPSILASFINCGTASDDNCQSSDSSTSENVTSSSEMSSDTDSPKPETPNNVELFRDFRSQSMAQSQHRFVGSPDDTVGSLRSCKPFTVQDENVFEDSSNHTTNAFLNRQLPLSGIFSLPSMRKDLNGQDYLEMFEKRCPPRGEGKVVLYFTSLSVIRKTFEDSRKLNLIMKAFRIYVDERDVWMHSRYREELTEVLGAQLPVPRLFILGRYIGGVEEVDQLNEDGILAKMIEGLPIKGKRECDDCGGYRFKLCITCSGSRKIVSEENMIEQCQDCNDIGLIMCPSCK
jgi:glutaredoxin domain-containing cysteine-rich protein 1